MYDETQNDSEGTSREPITQNEARTIKNMFKEYLKRYKEKDPSITDKEWLEELFRTELPELSEEEVKQDAQEIVESIQSFDENLASVNEAAKNGISKEKWLSNKIQEASVGMSVQEYGRTLQGFDDILYVKNVVQ